MGKLPKPKSTTKKTSSTQKSSTPPGAKIPKGYKAFLEDLKTRIRSTQLKAAISVNSELINLYWKIGKDITERQNKEGWGTLVIERLAQDLQNAFPGIQGFSRRNLFYMRKFADAYQDYEIMQQLAALIPWGHTMMLLDRVKSQEQRIWYTQQTIQNGWSRSSLEDWIKADLYKKKGKAITNFTEKLPDPQSRLAQETLKDPYNFDFLSLTDGYKELELEQGMNFA